MAGRRVAVGVLGIAAAVVGGALAVASLHDRAQTVTIRPAARGAFPAGTLFVAQGGTLYATEGCCTSVQANGAVTLYSANVTGDAAPVASFAIGMNGPQALALDRFGDLWVANGNDSTLVEFTRAELAEPNPAPKVTISPATPAYLQSPAGLAFDRSGDLWVVNNGSDTLSEYTQSQLAKSGSPRPRVIASPSFAAPGGAAFDLSGDLWVSNVGTLIEFTRAELAQANPSPSVTIASDGSSIDGGSGLAFSSAGDLWLSNSRGNTLVEFTKTQLAESGAPEPAVMISAHPRSSAGSLTIAYPGGLALDSAGDLWVCNYQNGTVVQFAKDQLTRSGAPVPVRTVAGPKTGMNWPSFVAIQP